ncbi:hypothetical protein AAC387_Pa03g2937 [Persea americana]
MEKMEARWTRVRSETIRTKREFATNNRTKLEKKRKENGETRKRGFGITTVDTSASPIQFVDRSLSLLPIVRSTAAISSLELPVLISSFRSGPSTFEFCLFLETLRIRWILQCSETVSLYLTPVTD